MNSKRYYRLKRMICAMTVVSLLTLPQAPVLAEESSVFGETISEETLDDQQALAPEAEEETEGAISEEAEFEEEIWGAENEAAEDTVAEDTIDPCDVGTPNVSVEKCDEDTGEFIIRIKGVQLNDGEILRVPVWCAADQADIIWNYAEKDGDSYIVRDSVARHGYRTGTYSIHVYKKNTDGTRTFLTNTRIHILPTAESVSATVTEDGKAAILLKDLKTYGTVSDIRFAVWTGENGQDDIKWYKVPMGSDGTCRTEIDLSRHSGSGITYVHAYAFTKAGAAVCLQTNQFDKPQETTVTGITVTGPDKETGDFMVTISGISASGLESVSVPIWSRVDQSDIVWYTAEKSGDAFVVKGNLANHQWSTGTYYIHVYRKNTGGAMVFTGNEEMPVAAPSVGAFTATVKGTSFTLNASGVDSMIGINEIRIPVWSKPDQSDIVWYRAKKVNDTYVVESDSSMHKGNTGKFLAHLYLKGKDNKLHYIGQTSFQIQEKSAALSTAALGAGDTFKITLKNYYSGATVRFAVWSQENGQDDIKWYSAEENGSDYVYTVTDTRHRTNGIVHIHAYMFKADGSAQFISAAEYKMSYSSADEVKVSNIDHATGTFTVTAAVDPSRDVKAMNIAIWSTVDQSNIKWYSASRQSDGRYQVKMNYLNHGGLGGTYYVHAYVYDSQGKATLIGMTTAVLKIEAGITVEKISAGECIVKIPASSVPASTIEILCPTWSVDYGQDDIKWYTAARKADGSYTVTISAANHLHNGSFIIDCYAKKQTGEMTLLKRLTTELTGAGNGTGTGGGREFDAEARAVMRNIIYAVETGGQVYGNHRYNDFTEAYTNSSGETAITIGAGAWFATEAKHLLSQIRSRYPSVFSKYDTAGIGTDLDNANWKYYGTDGAGHRTIVKGSAKAVAIQNIIGSPEGIAVQDTLIDEQMVKYADQAQALGVTDLKARLFCANIQHLGGYNAMVRIINYCKNDKDALTMENLWTNMREREAGGGNYVGSDIYASRHKKVMQWLNTYL